MKRLFFSVILLFCFAGGAMYCLNFVKNETADTIIFYEVNSKIHRLSMIWKNEAGSSFSNFEILKKNCEKENKKLVFAMNGGMFLKDYSPQGLFIENGIQRKKIDTTKVAYGNFYMQPNGVFSLNFDGSAKIQTTQNFSMDSNIAYATQSGPMLLIEGNVHPLFIKGSTNLHIRNGVGILSNGNLVFAISREKINFYDFASFFKSKGCTNALYLDGFVSRMYLPSKNWTQLDGEFGVIIAEIK